MLRRSLVKIALAGMLAATGLAGGSKSWRWPMRHGYFPQEVCKIGVWIDIGYWIYIVDQGNLKLEQTDINTYKACRDLEVKCNFDVVLDCTISPTGTVAGDYTCSLHPDYVCAPGAPPHTEPTLYVELKNADFSTHRGGSKNVHVATVTITVVPR